MIKRRKFLLGSLGIMAFAGLGVLGFGRTLTQSEIVSHLRRRLGFLKLDEAGLHQFAHDQISFLLAKRPTWVRWKYHFLHLFTAKAFSRFDSSDDKRSRLERVVDNLAETYLLSSDFFRNGADDTRVVTYVRFYDPLLACGNPFARPAVDAGPGGKEPVV